MSPGIFFFFFTVCVSVGYWDSCLYECTLRACCIALPFMQSPPLASPKAHAYRYDMISGRGFGSYGTHRLSDLSHILPFARPRWRCTEGHTAGALH